jgi:phosphatidylglycerol:prolipoprotein diacylglycerol transferase
MHPVLFKIPGLNITIPSFGAVVMLGFLVATFWAARRCSRVKIDPDMALNLGFIILIFGTLSARVFYVVHYWDSEFAHQPAQVFNIRAGGMEVYGGIIGGFLACAIYIKLKRMSLRLLSDIVAPSLLLAMGVGRIGCFLYGCCWGTTCSEQLPWAVRFPFASPACIQQWQDRRLTLPAELIFISPDGLSGPMPRQILDVSDEQLRKKLAELKAAIAEANASGDDAKIARAEQLRIRVTGALQPLTDHLDAFGTSLATLRVQADLPEHRCLPVHPVQLYSAVGPILLAFVTGAYFYRRRRHGTVILLGMSVYAVERFIEEMLRLDNPQDTLGLTISQAISLGLLALAALAYLVIRRLPLHSPRSVAPIPPAQPVEPPTP